MLIAQLCITLEAHPCVIPTQERQGLVTPCPMGRWAPFSAGALLLAGAQLLTASPRMLCGGC